VWLLLTGDRCLTTEHKTSTGAYVFLSMSGFGTWRDTDDSNVTVEGDLLERDAKLARSLCHFVKFVTL